MEQRDLKYEFYIGAAPETVWNALVSPEGTRQTFFGSVIHSTFEAGAPYEYIGPGAEGPDVVHVYGTILAYEPNKLLSMTEHPGATYAADHETRTSRITYTLETMGGCTKLTLVNDQWSPDNASYENAEKHWWMILSNIKTLCETGKTLDFGW
ncbi:SRPBCC family protein [Paenibacillus chartarius]|uniref:SRPBCC family protein n=1 Tax=Paenibacillus chartarius TaxID=747481 RepID=A0ABV6DR71_9BACL